MQKEKAKIPALIVPGACNFSNFPARTTWALDLKFSERLCPLPIMILSEVTVARVSLTGTYGFK